MRPAPNSGDRSATSSSTASVSMGRDRLIFRRVLGPLALAAPLALIAGVCLVGAIQAGEQADALAAAPECSVPGLSGCRTLVSGTLTSGVDLGGLIPTRELTITARDGTIVHISGPSYGPELRIGDKVSVESWEDAPVLVSGATSASRTWMHPAELVLQRERWCVALLAPLLALVLRAISGARGSPPLRLLASRLPVRFGPSPYYRAGLVLVLGDAFLYAQVAPTTAVARFVVISTAIVVGALWLAASGRRADMSEASVRHMRKRVNLAQVHGVDVEWGLTAMRRDRVLVLLKGEGRTNMLTVDTKRWDWRSRARFIETLAALNPSAAFSDAAQRLRSGYPPSRSETRRALGVWDGQSRRATRALVAVSAVLMVLGLLAEPVGAGRVVSMWLFMGGSVILGVSLPRSPRVLMTYFGDRGGRARFALELGALATAYAIDVAGEVTSSPPLRMEAKLASLIPWMLVFLFVWVPLANAGENYDEVERR